MRENEWNGENALDYVGDGAEDDDDDDERKKGLFIFS